MPKCQKTIPDVEVNLEQKMLSPPPKQSGESDRAEKSGGRFGNHGGVEDDVPDGHAPLTDVSVGGGG